MPNIDFSVTDNSGIFKDAKDELVQKALETIGLIGEGYAKLACPVDTGRLRNSISHAVDEQSAVIGTNVEYAAYVEYGTTKTKAQPYLKPAATEHGDEYREIVESTLKGG